MTGAIVRVAEALAGSAAAWGEGDAAPSEVGESASIPDHAMDVGEGHTLQLSPEQLYELLRSPEVLAMLDQHGQQLVEKANSMAITEGAEYTYLVQANDGYETPQVFLYPANFQAKIDDAAHSTLLKVAATVNDDVPVETAEDEEVWIPVESPEFEDYRLPSGRTLWSKAAGR